ncbi:MAG: efflux RND transporter periplasmic adaptor subunit [Caldithrix sp.]|nr:efflux RND transporter periplasmic adaptor subunit [Caldithrix sp.]
MRRKTVINFILIFGLAFVFIYCGKPGNQQKNSKTSKADTAVRNTPGQNKDSNSEAVPVEITRAVRGDISDFILLSSNLETEKMADVYARIQGIVEKIYKEEGSYVRKGDTLLTLEAKEYVLAEEKARNEYEKQMKNYERMQQMFNKDLLSKEEFENAKYALNTARVAWEEARLNLNYTQIKAPISGRIGERLAKIGQRIQPTDKLFSVVNNTEVIAVVYVPEKYINSLQIRQDAYITSDHLQGQSFDAWIKRISPVVDPSSGTFKVTVGVRNRNNQLRPGMFVNVHIIIDTHEDVVLVPKTAIVYENEYMNVYVVQDSVAHKIRLNPGFQDNKKVEALDKIEANDKIIVVGQAGMKDKTPVKIVRERESRITVAED